MAFVALAFRKDYNCKTLLNDTVCLIGRGRSKSKVRYSYSIREFGGSQSFTDLVLLPIDLKASCFGKKKIDSFKLW